MLYYRSLRKSKECSKTEPTLKVANIEEMESLYCSGRDLEIPLVSSLSLCSPEHKSKVDECIRDFAEAFSKDPSDKSLCRYLHYLCQFYCLRAAKCYINWIFELKTVVDTFLFDLSICQ